MSYLHIHVYFETESVPKHFLNSDGFQNALAIVYHFRIPTTTIHILYIKNVRNEYGFFHSFHANPGNIEEMV